MEGLIVIENQGKRVLTTQQLAKSYEANEKRISENFNSNKGRYIEGKHYFYLEGDCLNEFLQYGNSGVQNPSKVRSLYLWTEKGALLHAKSLNTDKAWEVYDYLVESYAIIGYAGYFELLNGFRKSVYWTKEQIEKHKKKFSKSDFGWNKDFDAMAKKTVIRNMISKWGILSIEMQKAYSEELSGENQLIDNTINEDMDLSTTGKVIVEADIKEEYVDETK